jgi:diguanylate cyclase (GGDEF)-like protein/PAS domain S-box-containing protein
MIKTRILVVDDDPTTRLLISNTLECNDFIFYEAVSGEDALKFMDESQIDAVILDVHLLGEMNGYDVCKRMRLCPGGQFIPIIMITGDKDFSAITKAYEAEATDFITKPLNFDLLPYRLRYLLKTNEDWKELLSHRHQLIAAKRIAAIADWSYDIRKNIVSWSDELFSMLDITPIPISIHEKILDYIHDDDRTIIKQAINELFANHREYEVEFRIRTNNFEIRYVYEKTEVLYDDNHNPIYFFGIIQDITKRKEAEKEIKFLAYHDSLTRLPNRAMFLEQLELSLIRAKRLDQPLAILFMDLDDFKKVNDAYGHGIGDQLLIEVGIRLSNYLKECKLASQNLFFFSDIQGHPLARFGGDEFIILLQNHITPESVVKVAEKLISIINKPFEIDNESFLISTSIGISLFPHDGETATDLLKNADAAMYQAKKTNKNLFRFYDKLTNDSLLRRVNIEKELFKSISHLEINFVYQPIINFKDTAINAFELLMRWTHPLFGNVSPEEFIPIAEDLNLTDNLTAITLQYAEIAYQKLTRFSDNIALGINLSVRQFYSNSLLSTLNDAFAKNLIQPEKLIIELTETIVMTNYEKSISILNDLQKLGVRVYLDDFGKGYSSFEYLVSLPVNAIKIDRSFVIDAEQDERKQTIIKGLISLAHGLNLTIIAEGVGNKHIATFLAENGCDQGQGYYFSKPTNLETFIHDGKILIEGKKA